MRILLVDADSKRGFPNLALMKLSAYYKRQGDTVDLIRGIPSTAPLEPYYKTYISCLYYQNAERVEDYMLQLKGHVVIGGCGWSNAAKLDDEIEHIMPDYDLYKVKFSMGYTSRGCIRNCSFCIVPSKEGPIRDNAPISEFLHPEHNKLILLDNNFLASPRWLENIQYIVDNKLMINFNQGLDIRVLTEQQALWLAECKYRTWKFDKKGLHFAFDDIRYEQDVLRGIKYLTDAGIKLRNVLFYILIGYNSTEEEDLYRIRLLRDVGVIPYVMPYNRQKSDLTRWVNRRYYQFVPWKEYRKTYK